MAVQAKTRLSRLAVAFAVGLSVGALIVESAAAATAHGIRVSGPYGVTDLGATTCIPLDESRLRCTTIGLESSYGGDLEGVTSSEFEQVIDCARGRAMGSGVETFTGSLRGGPQGSLVWRVFFTADFDCTTFFPSNLRILGVVETGSGALASFRGVLLFDDTSYRGVLA